MSILGFEEHLTNDFDQLELPRKMNAMSDVNDDAKHIATMERFLQLCVERILDKNQKTNEKLYTIASSINAITEFIIAESKYARSVNSDITKLLSNVQITKDINE
jgi:hypothetical protein